MYFTGPSIGAQQWSEEIIWIWWTTMTVISKGPLLPDVRNRHLCCLYYIIRHYQSLFFDAWMVKNRTQKRKKLQNNCLLTVTLSFKLFLADLQQKATSKQKLVSIKSNLRLDLPFLFANRCFHNWLFWLKVFDRFHFGLRRKCTFKIWWWTIFSRPI